MTVHNVYPHDMSDIKREHYHDRFIKADKYIVYVDSSKKDLENDLGISPAKIAVIPHGIFTPSYVPNKQKEYMGRHIIMY